MSAISRRLILRRLSAAAMPALAAAQDPYAALPSTDEIFAWITDLWRFGDQSKYRFRMPGTAADHAAVDYLERRLRSFGLAHVDREPVSIFVAFPDRWSLTLHAAGGDESLPCGYLPYAAFTGPEGVRAELVYAGPGGEGDFRSRAVAGKIVAVDLIAPPTRYADLMGSNPLLFDPRQTLAAEPTASEGFPVVNLASSVAQARRHGAVGLIGILTFRSRDNWQEYHGPKYGNQVIPALTVSPASGQRLKARLAAGPLEATLVATEQKEQARNVAFGSWGVTYNLYGLVEGAGDEVVVVMSHHDGSATNEASGASVVLALAQSYARRRKASRKRSLLFFLKGSHFGWRPPMLDHARRLAAAKERVVCAANIEMIARHMRLIDGRYVPTDLPSPTQISVTGGSKRLTSIVWDAVRKHQLERTVVGGRPAGEGIELGMAGFAPVIERIALNAPQFSYEDTPETVMKEALRPTACAFIDILDAIDALPAADLRGPA